MDPDNYLIIFQDLLVDDPRQPEKLPPLQNLNWTDAEIMRELKRKFERAIQRRCRISVLVYAYRIGEQIESQSQPKAAWKSWKKKVSRYYYDAIKRTYLLFENNELQIYRTKKTTLKMIRDLKLQEFQRLVEMGS